MSQLPALDEVGPGSVTWKIHRERLLILGWGRAVLMQVAHPKIAEAVYAHSYFSHSGQAYIKRLRGTIGAMLSMTFDPPEKALATIQHINKIHERVQGEMSANCSPYSKHTPYSALEPKLLLWVYLTLLDTHIRTYEMLIEPLTDQERDTYVRESRLGGQLLLIPPEMLPYTWGEVQALVKHELQGPEVKVCEHARYIAQMLAEPPFIQPVRSLFGLWKVISIGMLPDTLREQYRFDWGRPQSGAYNAAIKIIRTTVPVLPDRARYWQKYLLAMKRLRAEAA